MDNIKEKATAFFDINWQSVIDYGLKLLVTVFITFAVIFLIRIVVHQLFKKTNIISEKKEQTIESVLRNTSNYIAFFIILLAAIKPFVDIKDLLVAGGVIGIVIGFGAQSLITDLLSGAFMIFERTVQKGDFVHVNGEPDGGTVEELGFRVVKIRLVNGKLLTVPNGQIKKMLNGSVERRRIFESVVVSYDESPARVTEILQNVCVELNERNKDFLKLDKNGEIIEEFKVYGLSSLDFSQVGYKYSITATVNDTDYIDAAQSTKMLIAQRFYENNIIMPAQQVIIRS